jgi:hypothetical protein
MKAVGVSCEFVEQSNHLCDKLMAYISGRTVVIISIAKTTLLQA